MTRHTPTIRAGVLILESSAGGRHREVRPESDAWFQWLDSARTFIFEDSSGRFTARKKRRSGADYWYAIRRGSGRLYETYLGKARDITLGRLHAAVVKLDGLARRASSARSAAPADVQPHPAGATDQRSSSALVTTLSMPHVRLAQLVRTSAVDRLARMVEHPLTVVSAPAGYGKTTAVAQAIATLRLPAAWVSLDGRDNDPARFWAQVSAALERVVPGLREAGPLAAEPRTTQTADGVLAGLSVVPQAPPSPLVLVLDDYHELHAENRAIHDAVALLVEHVPPWMHLVVASRIVPPLPLAKLRTRHDLLELGAADLQLTPDETRSLLGMRTVLDLSDEEIAVLHARTEGWVSALQLAALSLSRQPDPRAWIAAFSGENRYIFDYLVEEVIKHVPSRVYDFALHVCLLDRLCGPLCDAVTRASNGQTMLDEMERYNLFLVPLDDRREWYRLHRLFADVLRRHLRQTRPRLVPRLYARASEWCEAHEQSLDAIDYAFEATEPEEEHVAQLVEAYIPTALASGYFVLLRERLERLPDRLVRARPRLAVAHAYVLYMTGERTLWLQRVRDAEVALTHAAPQLDPAARAILRAEILTLRSGVDTVSGASSARAAVAALRHARAVLPRDDEFQQMAALYLGINQTLDGDVRAARQTLDTLMHASAAQGNTFYVGFTLLYLGLTTLVQGRLDDTLAFCAWAQQRLEGYGDDDMESRMHLMRGKVFYEYDDLEQALGELEQGISLRYDPGPFLIEGFPALAYAQFALGNVAAARQTMERGLAEWAATQAEQKTIWVWTGRHLRAHQARLWLLDGDVEAAAGWARELESSGGAAAEGTAEPPTYVREWEEIVLARLYLAEHRAADALTLLEKPGVAAAAAGRIARLLEILVLRACACDALGDAAAALRVLQHAVELGKPQCFVRTFVEGGPAIQRLLVRLRAERTPREEGVRPHRAANLRPYIVRLLDAMGSLEEGDGGRRVRRLPRAPADEAAIRPSAPQLTKQQRLVIRLIAAGASNEDISRALVIEPSTAKRHVSNIFARFEVHSRTQAVARARALGYLSPDDQPGAPSDIDR